jgi:putative transcriptional regulator
MLLRRSHFPRAVLPECDDGRMPPSEDPEDSVAPAAQRVRAGTLLLANTDLLEPTFRRSVIYIVEHNDGGTLGVVLNRSSETAVYNVLPQWAKLTAKPKTMFIGGPVKRDAALCLATLRVGSDPEGVPGLRHVAGRIVMVDLDAEPDLISPLVEGVRIFAGYSGWTIGQLEGEIERDDWIVLSALPSDVLAGAKADLWGQVLRRQPLPLSLLATHPIDVSRN